MSAFGESLRFSGMAFAAVVLALSAVPPMAGPASAGSRNQKNWIERAENRRDARRAGVVAGVVTAQVAGAAGRGRADKAFRECRENLDAMTSGERDIHGNPVDPYADYAARRAGYDCEVQRYEARADGRKAARRTAVVAGIVTREIVKD